MLDAVCWKEMPDAVCSQTDAGGSKEKLDAAKEKPVVTKEQLAASLNCYEMEQKEREPCKASSLLRWKVAVQFFCLFSKG